MLSSKASLVNVAGVKLNITSIRNHVKISPWRTLRNKRECYLDNTEKPYTDRHNPAEFMHDKKQLKPWQRVLNKEQDGTFNDYFWHDSYISRPKKAKETSMDKFKKFKDSLSARGAARESKAYTPPSDVERRVVEIYKAIQSKSPAANDTQESTDLHERDTILAINLDADRSLKFNLIVHCIKQFEHDLPCSHLNEMSTIQDLVGYFSTPVRGINPYDQLVKNDELPPNLFLLSDPHRFDVESDTYFGGYNAYPGLVSQVPGLRAKKKYPVLNQKEFQWPDV